MSQYTILYNPHAGNGQGQESVQDLKSILSGDDLDFYDMTLIEDYSVFFGSLPQGTQVVISGGDGTLNRFINDTLRLNLSHDIYYYASGSGNDFLRDVGRKKEDGPFRINQYLRKLPEVTVAGHTYKFLNGVGYGIDGYC